MVILTFQTWLSMTKDRTLSTSIHILCILGVLKNEFVSSTHLAKSLQTNAGFVRRMLLKLSESGLIVTTKGIGGGSKLAKPANKITLDQIYKAVSYGPIFGINCFKHSLFLKNTNFAKWINIKYLLDRGICAMYF